MRVSDLASLFNGAHHFHLHPVGKLQVKELMAELGIVLVEFIELALLEEQDGIIVVLLDSPELSIARLVNQFENRQLRKPYLLLEVGEGVPRA